MQVEKTIHNKKGTGFLQVGAGKLPAVGSPRPGHDMPLQEGLRLVQIKVIDDLWALMVARHLLRKLFRHKRKRRH